MRIQATKIEQLDLKHPGLRLDVDLMLDKQATLDAITQMLATKHGETMSIKTVSNYKQRRWLLEKTRIGELKTLFRAVKDELGENAISESTQALILEKLSEAMSKGAALDPHFLLKEQRLWAQHEVKLKQVEQEKQKLERENQKLNEARERERGQLEKAVGEKDPKRALEQIRDIYNLPAAGSGAASALPGEVGRG